MEKDEQIALFEWAELQRHKYPELSFMFHIPNGGSRNKIEAVNLKRQGVKSGVPDIFLPVPKGGKSGLFIEMKYGKNKLSDNQKKWVEMLHRRGYEIATCYSWKQAATAIIIYLEEE